MVGPTITNEDREAFLVKVKVGFALLLGLSMGMVTVYSGSPLVVTVGVTLGTTVLSGVAAWVVVPDSVAGLPYEKPSRGPKPGARTRARRREREDGPDPHRTDGDGWDRPRQRD